MQSSSSESGADFEQLKKRWTALVKHLKDDPRVAQLLNTRLGRYLSSHSFVALTALMFCAMAAVPVGLFVTFAVVTMMISAVGFVFSFLLFVGGLALLWVLSGIALFAIVASAVVNVLHVTTFSLLNHYYPHLTKVTY
uniref:Promethin-like n=1 Tax=Neolamprologus brichardi TaxID=32507 RepID=A0A3Q4G4N7_NEOBR